MQVEGKLRKTMLYALLKHYMFERYIPKKTISCVFCGTVYILRFKHLASFWAGLNLKSSIKLHNYFGIKTGIHDLPVWFNFIKYMHQIAHDHAGLGNWFACAYHELQYLI